MKAKDVTRLQFAKWSFDRDRSVGLYETSDTWNNIPEDERQGYLEEADSYLGMDLTQEPLDWPVDILERLDR